ncbi:WD40/YVTN/BNR-like repeat-containing protein [Ferruginibacter sp. SUN002]|uniref:WD40/YVTN/BNR-like repeat-containing protein n=1 Tax=Ferruginibacter sp. SUN002 TaxID=2937789 RepID=UPI003D360832
MKPKLLLTLLLSVATFYIGVAQTVKTLATFEVSIRGLSVVNDRVIWVSGTHGAIGISRDSGNTFKWISVRGFEETDFRDIEAFDETTAVIMGTGEPAYILRTADAGETWEAVFVDKTKGMFLDAMEFWNENSGIVIGDPIDQKFFIGRTFNGGITWRGIPPENYPVADDGEACFAASGTNICKINNKEVVFVTGGKKSRLFIRDKKIDIPFTTDSASIGANSVAAKNSKMYIVVGGNYLAKDSTSNNCFITKEAGNKWIVPKTPPSGYRSCVEYIEKKQWVTCGFNGVDITNDDGMNWKRISDEGYNVCRKSKSGDAVFFAGDGKIGKLIF